MVNAQAVDVAACYQLEYEPVGSLEYRRILDLDAGQMVHVEKAPVVDFIRRDTPIGQAIGLALQQLVHRIGLRRIGRCPIVPAAVDLHRAGNRGQQRRMVGRQGGQASFERRLLAIAPLRRRQVGLVAARQVVEQQRQSAQLRKRGVAQFSHYAMIGHPLQDQGIGERIEWKSMVEILDFESPRLRIEAQRQFAALQHQSVMVSQDRQQQAIFQFMAGSLPVDVEIFGIGRCRTVFQYIEPPRVVAAQYAHMIGHDIGNLPHAMIFQSRAEIAEIDRRADLGIESAMVDDVVAVLAARARAQVRRTIDVAYAQFGQVGHQCRRIAEVEAGVKLQPIGGAGNPQHCGNRRSLSHPGAPVLRASKPPTMREARRPPVRHGWHRRPVRAAAQHPGENPPRDWPGGAAGHRPRSPSRR